MEMLIALGAIFGAILIGAISPGPSFVLVARTAIAVSRSAGMATALGMGLGGLMFAGAALLGLHVVLTAVPWAYLGLKVGGGAYLIFLAIRLWRGLASPSEWMGFWRMDRVACGRPSFLALRHSWAIPRQRSPTRASSQPCCRPIRPLG